MGNTVWTTKGGYISEGKLYSLLLQENLFCMMHEVERGGVRGKDGRRVKNITLSCNNLFNQLHAYYRASQIYYKQLLT